jgi:threonine/homoserine/homoserine lactone efflux protein
MDFFPALVTGIWVAILSSVPIGPINFALVQTVMTKGKRAAMMIAVGGMIADVVYCFLAMILFGWIAGDDNPALFVWLNLISIPVVIWMGISMIRKRNEVQQPKSTGKVGGGGIFLGMMLGISNPMLLGYWLWVASVVMDQGWVKKTLLDYTAFTLGMSGGIILAFFGFVNLIALGNRRASDSFRKLFTTAVGVGFIIFGIYLSIRFAYTHWPA